MHGRKKAQQPKSSVDDFLEFSISNSNALIPKLNRVRHQLNDYLSQSTDRTNLGMQR
jgi:hypothetical protein